MSPISKRKEIDYVGISTLVLKKYEGPLIFDVFIKRTQKDYTKIFKQGDTVDWKRLETYESKGVEFLFVTNYEYQIYLEHVEKLSIEMAKSGSDYTDDEAIDLLKEMVNYSMHEIMINHNINSRVMENTAKVVNGCVKGLHHDSKSLMKIVALMAAQPYMFKHSITVSILSVLLAKASGIESVPVLNLIGMGGFLHDIGVSQLTFDPEDEEILTAEQRREMWRHPEMGKRQLDSVKGVRSEVTDIILQHHEQPNGRGYPNGLRENEIYPPAKIVSIADAFSALITNRNHRKGLPTLDALEVMRSDIGKFDDDLLLIFTEMLIQGK